MVLNHAPFSFTVLSKRTVLPRGTRANKRLLLSGRSRILRRSVAIAVWLARISRKRAKR